VDEIDVEDEDSVEEQLIRVRAGLATAKLHKLSKQHMSPDSIAQLNQELQKWWEWRIGTHHVTEAPVGDEPMSPVKLLKQILDSVQTEDHTEIPGEQKYNAKQLAVVLQMSESEAQLLFDETDEDLQDNREFEEDRTPKMRDFMQLAATVRHSATNADRDATSRNDFVGHGQDVIPSNVVSSIPILDSMLMPSAAARDAAPQATAEIALMQTAHTDLQRVTMLLKMAQRKARMPERVAMLGKVMGDLTGAKTGMHVALKQVTNGIDTVAIITDTINVEVDECEGGLF
jgi:hypothetical protein